MIDKLNPLYARGIKPIPVIPTIYTDALSYGEQVGIMTHKIDECIDKVNEVVEDNNEFKTDLTEQQDTFEGNITEQQNTFESNITEQQSTFETNITNQQNTYEQETTAGLNTWKTDTANSFQGQINDLENAYNEFLEQYQQEFGVTSDFGDSDLLAMSQNKVTRSVEEIVESLGGIYDMSYNILPPWIEEAETRHGITITPLDDGTVKVNGTADYNVLTYTTIENLPNGTYILNGVPSGATTGTYCYYIRYDWNGTAYEVNKESLGGDIKLTKGGKIEVGIFIHNGATLNNAIYKPMIRPFTISDSTYREYGKYYFSIPYDNIIDAYNDAIGYDKPNLISVPFTNVSANGITLTRNDDWSVRVTGTSTGTPIFTIQFPIKAGTYKISGAPEGSANNTYEYFVVYNNNQTYFEFYGYGRSREFTVNTDDTITLSIRIRQVGITMDATFYPMIRDAKIYNDKYAKYGEYQIVYPVAKCVNNTDLNWSTKKLNAIGDSLVAGGYGNFVNVIGGILNLSTVRNYGIGGCLMASSDVDDTYAPVCKRYMNMDDDADIILVHAGTNDYSAQIPLGASNSTDITTFNGALNVVMQGLRDKYPTKLIIFDSILDRIEYSGLTITPDEYRQCIKDRCEANHMIFYDCYTYGGFDMSYEYYHHYLSPDGLHLNETGAKILGRKIAGFINWN